MKLFLVRHGEDEDNAKRILNGRRDEPLTPKGIEQARVTALKLRGQNIDTILSSPLKRAWQTANVIANEIGLPRDIVSHERLVERDFGVLTGKHVSEIPNFSSRLLHTERVIYFLEAEGAETFPEVMDRARRVVEDIRKNLPTRTVLIVAHGDILKMIQAVVMGWSWEEALRAPHIENCAVIELEI